MVLPPSVLRPTVPLDPLTQKNRSLMTLNPRKLMPGLLCRVSKDCAAAKKGAQNNKLTVRHKMIRFIVENYGIIGNPMIACQYNNAIKASQVMAITIRVPFLGKKK